MNSSGFLRYILAGVLMLHGASSRAEEITVAVAANFTAAMEQIKNAFEAESEHTLTVSYGSSGRLYAQTSNGAPYQIFFSADQDKPQALVDAGFADADNLFTYAIGKLVLWSPVEGRNMVQALNDSTGRLALANPRLAPYGAAAMQTLESMGLKELWAGRLVMGENVSQAFQFVDTGNAIAGFVALSQVMTNGNVDRGSVWIVPEDLYITIRQDAVVTKAGEGNQAVREFLLFMKSESAKKIMSALGYSTD